MTEQEIVEAVYRDAYNPIVMREFGYGPLQARALRRSIDRDMLTRAVTYTANAVQNNPGIMQAVPGVLTQHVQQIQDGWVREEQRINQGLIAILIGITLQEIARFYISRIIRALLGR